MSCQRITDTQACDLNKTAASTGNAEETKEWTKNRNVHFGQIAKHLLYLHKHAADCTTDNALGCANDIFETIELMRCVPLCTREREGGA